MLTKGQIPLCPSVAPCEREADMGGRPSNISVHHPPAEE